MRKEFKITMAQHVRLLWIHVLSTLLLIATAIWIIDYFFAFLLVYAFLSIPAMFLYAEYLLHNHHQRIVLEDGLMVVYYKEVKQQEIRRDDIALIRLVRSSYQGMYPQSVISSYFYHKIQLKSGEKLHITSLLNNDRFTIKNRYANTPFEEKTRLFCSPLLFG